MASNARLIQTVLGLRGWQRIVAIVVVAGIAWFTSRGSKTGDAPSKGPRAGQHQGANVPAGKPKRDESIPAGDIHNADIIKLHSERRLKQWAVGRARVIKVLPDDTHPPKHQQFLIDTEGGFTVKVAHNIDVAKRAPIKRGTIIEYHGRYEWNEKGGVLHWTHRPKYRTSHSGGWLKVDGKTYR